ncbi:GNAT family N-acetyltransferase [Actinomadura verrucosospora]|uniref:Glycosyl transferase family 1 n=1 Tax=Actinomadura verrucosospora TaxID=46165 RepID=A0A7D4A3D4_ACTVE|nr:GNAT family N-acetyltransferase [Actinomadura verrucosospora]QKG24204.1 glycosyl transferase family 1 [Actinomadura verrucosospora]
MTQSSVIHPGRAAAPAETWRVEVRRDEGALIELGDELRDLYERSPEATPFQSHEWLSAWWGWYGIRGRLRLVLVRYRGRLVAAAPLMTAGRWGFPVLVPIADEQSDFTDFLLDPAYTDGAVEHLARALHGMRGRCAIDLREVRPGSVVHQVMRRWPGRTWPMPASVCMELPCADIADVLDRLPRRSAGKMRAKLRKIDVRGITAETVPPEEAADAIGALLEMHARQWRGRPMNPEHARERFRRHLAEAGAAMVREGRAAVLRYHWDGRLVASDLVLIGHRFVGAYLYGAIPELRDGVDVTLMLLREDLALARARGRQAVNLLRGEEPYKLKWRPSRVQNQRIVLGRSFPASVFAGLALVRAGLAARRHHRPATVPPPAPSRDGLLADEALRAAGREDVPLPRHDAMPVDGAVPVDGGVPVGDAEAGAPKGGPSGHA